MKKIVSVFDTSICSYNVGNDIIMDAVGNVIDEMMPFRHLVRLSPTNICRDARLYNAISEMTFVGGTNILCNDVRRNLQWNLTLHNVLMLKNVVLLGCGWFQYEASAPTRYTQWSLNRILSKQYLHSVRDNYTKEKLASMGIDAINTGCPTLWGLSDEIMGKIPAAPKRKAVFTITDYNRNPQRDIKMLQACEAVYKDGLICFPQGTGDYEYIKSLGYYDKVDFIAPRLKEYDALLASGAVDYIGTRLHAGIRALQHSVRSFIIGVDNRAIEMRRDFSIPVIYEEEMDNLAEEMSKSYDCILSLPLDNIKQWKEQFI